MADPTPTGTPETPADRAGDTPQADTVESSDKPERVAFRQCCEGGVATVERKERRREALKNRRLAAKRGSGRHKVAEEASSGKESRGKQGKRGDVER